MCVYIYIYAVYILSWTRPKDKRVHQTYELPHDKTNKMTVRPAKTQISLGFRPAWSDSSLSAWRKLGSLATDWAHSEDSDQPRYSPSQIWVFAGRTCHYVGFVMRRRDYVTCFSLCTSATASSQRHFSCSIWFLWDSQVLRSFSFSNRQKWAATWQNQQNDCAPSEDSYQPGHLPGSGSG